MTTFINEEIKNLLNILSFHEDYDSAYDDIQKKLQCLIKKNRKSKKDTLLLISEMPCSLFLLNFKETEYDYFKDCLITYFNTLKIGNDKFRFLNIHSLYYKSNKIFPLDWFQKHSNLLTEEIFENLMVNYNKSKNIVNLIGEINDVFYNNIENKENYINIINKHLEEVPFSLIENHLELFNEDFYTKNKADILEQKNKYYKGSFNLFLELYGNFMSYDDIKESALHLSSEQHLDFIKRFSYTLDDEDLSEILFVFFKSKKHKKLKFLSSIDLKFLNLIAEKVVSYNPMNYMALPLEKRIELLDKIDFKKYKVLINKHPEPESLRKEDWMEAFEGGYILPDNVPNSFINGEQRLSIDEWAVFFTNIKSLKNNAVKSFFNKFEDEEYKFDILYSIYNLENSNINRKEFVVSSYQIKKRNDHVKETINNAIDSAHTNDEKELGKTLIHLFSERLGSLENIEKVLKEFKK